MHAFSRPYGSSRCAVPTPQSSHTTLRRPWAAFGVLAAAALAAQTGCTGCTAGEEVVGHGPIAPLVTGPMGTPRGGLTSEQLETFERGEAVLKHRFTIEEGLGPEFNVTFCGACHEKPVFGGSAGLYRNFFLTGRVDSEGVFRAGPAGGVIRLYNYANPSVTTSLLAGVSGADAVKGETPSAEQRPAPARAPVAPEVNVFAQRNPIPFFGVGLLAELSDEEILKYADPDDLDRDGVSGRPNYDRGFVGRFGRKSQTVSIEGFIRGPLFNHLGITTDPLTDAQRAKLPVDSSGSDVEAKHLADEILKWAQAAAPDGPLVDDDAAADPEMTRQELFDLVSYTMLLAAPRPEPLNAQTTRGLQTFDAIGCNTCHVPRLVGPRGPLPVYSDLLLHDMGEDMSDGLLQKEATASEFRTQPLWGLVATGPFLHDGRAHTIDAAISYHGGEGERARNRYNALDDSEREDLIAFLESLGGRDQYTDGLLAKDTPLPAVGEYGGPIAELSPDDETEFLLGREMFDHEFGFDEGVGGPRLNGDSCRACHFDPVLGGSGPRGVNVTRSGILNGRGEFTMPSVGTILHRVTALNGRGIVQQEGANVFEHRQTPHLFGLGLIESIPEATIRANADPGDLDGDGISGRVSEIEGGRLGRFGLKAQVPSIDEFVRDAVTAELGMTLPLESGLTFGKIHDNDAIADPEFSLDDANLLRVFLHKLGPPPRTMTGKDPALVAAGEELFETVGCTKCHTPSMQNNEGVDVNLYSDLLLHAILPDGAPGIEEASATMQEFRTTPLWGLATTAPYFHHGAADTIDQAVRMHAGEAAAVTEAYTALSTEDQDALLEFLGSL